MKKTEVRWISRDQNSNTVEIWKIKPTNYGGVYVNPKTQSVQGRISQTCGLEPWVAIKLAAGGLAKVTIERQY